MSTTTLRLPPDVKARIDKLAASSGKSTHAFMVETLTESADWLERKREFEAEAARRLKKYLRTGEYYTVEDARDYILARARGEPVERPKPRTLTAPELARLRAGAR